MNGMRLLKNALCAKAKALMRLSRNVAAILVTLILLFVCTAMTTVQDQNARNVMEQELLNKPQYYGTEI
jgi:hypothetical protein